MSFWWTAICGKMVHSDHSRPYLDQKFWISVLKATIFGRTPRSLPQIPHFYTATCGRLVSCDKLATFILYNTSTSTPTCILRLVLVLVPQVTLVCTKRISSKVPPSLSKVELKPASPSWPCSSCDWHQLLMPPLKNLLNFRRC